MPTLTPDKRKKPVNWLKQNHIGNTMLHWAATDGYLDQAPKELLTEENMRIKNNAGDSVLHKAAFHGNLHQIPICLLTEANITLNGNFEWTPLHMAAQGGHVDQIPIESITQHSLSIQTLAGATPLHDAAANGHLNQIPKNVVTKSLMCMRTQILNATPLDWAASFDMLHRVPRRLLIFMLQNDSGMKTLIENVAQYSNAIFSVNKLETWSLLNEKAKSVLRDAFSYVNCPYDILQILQIQNDGPATWADSTELQAA